MKRTLSLIGLTTAALMASVSVPALAQSSSESSSYSNSFWDLDQWYLGLAGGWNRQDPYRIALPSSGRNSVRSVPIGTTAIARTDYDNSYVGLVTAGREFGDGWRGEFELGYRDASVRRIGGYAAEGDSHTYSAMANGLYDFDLGLPVTPYLGAGLGTAIWETHNNHLSYGTGPTSSASTGPSFAYQAMAGISYDITPQWKLGLEYRYFGIVDHPTGTLEAYKSHSALINIRYGFGEEEHQEMAQTAAYVPPPVQAPQPARAPRNYLVFFDFDKSDLTSDARQIVDQAAQNVKGANVTRISVTGHTDTVGSDAYNLRLSHRRAESVSSELQAQGVPESEIAIYAKGKRDLLVPTADGVREPQNRRVQIVFEDGSPSS